jgi:ABC-type sugar transport system substrate-binding protein
MPIREGDPSMNKTARHLLRALALIVTSLIAGLCAPPRAAAQEPRAYKIAVMPKLVGIDYFNAVQKGAREAAAELGVELIYDGPVDNDVTKQARMVESWIARKVDAICIAPNDPDAIAPVLRKARARGIKVLTYDADAKENARDFFVNQATYEAIAQSLIESMVKGIGPDGKYIILTGSLTAVNQNIWMREMEKYRLAHYPGLTNLSPTPKATEEDQALATQVTIDVLKTYPDLKGIFAITSVALPGAAEGLMKENAAGRIFLTGLSTPNSMREYVKKGALKEFVLWNPVNLGYLTVHAAAAQIKGDLTKDSAALKAGRLGEVQIKDGVILLGAPTVFTAENIDQFDF